MNHRISSGKAATGLLAVVAVGLGLAASIGAGYTVAHAALSDPSAYVAKGTAVSHVNGESRSVDATSRSVAKDGDDVDVVGLPGGKVVAVDRTTGAVTVQDGGTMTTTSTAQTGGKDSGTTRHAVRVVSSGSNGWLVDQDGSSVRRVVDGDVRKAVRLDHAPVDGAPGPDGSVIVLTTDGEVLHIGTNGDVHTVDVAKAGGGALTVAGGHTYLVTTAGAVIQVDSGEPVRVAAVNGPSTGPDGRMLVGSAASPGEHVLVAIPGGIVVVDPQTGEKFSISDRAGSDTLGQPVEYRGKVYVPDFTTHAVLVLDEKSMQPEAPQKVPGSQRTFALFISGGRLWANDQYAQHLIEFDRGGRHTVDKGTGNNTRDDSPPKSTPPTSGGHNGHGGSHGTGGSGPTSTTGGQPTGGGGSDGGGTAKPRLITLPRFGPHTPYQEACAQIEALGPTCTPVSRDQDGDTDEVIETAPGEGSRVLNNTSVTVVYVGPTMVPDFADGTTPVEACNALTTAGLKCTLAASAVPADDPSRYGLVAQTEPVAGSPVHSGTTVVVRYYDSFRVPDFVAGATKGTAACASLRNDQLQLPDHSAIAPQCTAVPGAQSVSRADKTKADTVYHQNAPANSVYRPGPSARPIQLTVYNSKAKLTDYRLASGNQISAQDAVDDCSKLFECGFAQNSVVPVDGNGQLQLTWIGKVAAIHDPSGNDVPPGQAYRVGSGTHIRIVPYGGDQGANNTVPNTIGQDPATACQMIAAAGFTCSQNDVPGKMTDPSQVNKVYSQNPAQSEQPLGATVAVTYSTKQVYPLNLYHQNADPDVHALVLATNPAPAGYTLDEQVAWAWQPDAINVNWNLRQFEWNCVNHTDNILYSHGAPDGCLHDHLVGKAAGVAFPTDTSAAGDGSNCGWGGTGVWIWRVDYAPSGTATGGFTVVLGDANLADQPNTPGYREPLGCVFPP